MRLNDIIKRVDLRRESKPQELHPYENFLQKISAAARLLYFVENETKEKTLRLETRKYFIIICISAMETYFRDIAQGFVDAGWTKEDFLNSLSDDKIALRDLLEITRKRISIGEIVSVSYSFQDIERINKTYTKMFGVKDFLSEIASAKVKTRGAEFVLKTKYPDFREDIEEMIKLRHLIVHHESFRRIGLGRLGQLYFSLDSFVNAVENYILEKIPEV